MQWGPSRLDWCLQGLVVLLGMNFLHLAGAHRFAQFADLGAAVGRALLGWLLTLGTLFAATFSIEPVTATDGPWIALWCSGVAVLLVASRVVLHHRMAGRSRPGRLGEVVAIVGAGPIAQRLLRGMNSAHGGPRVFGVYDDEASHLPQRDMGHAILGSVDDLVRDARSHLIHTVIMALPSRTWSRVRRMPAVRQRWAVCGRVEARLPQRECGESGGSHHHAALAHGVLEAIDNVYRLNRLQERAFAACSDRFDWLSRGRQIVSTIAPS
jgi:FlaA1/EpsC-like NDP-sugar epimerase